MGPMRRLTSVAGPFAANLVAARLQSEGIDVQLRGAVASPYVLTVGDIARVDVYVPEDQLDDATLVMLADEVDAAMAEPDEWDADAPAPRRWPLWIALGLVAVAASAPVLRYFAAF